MKTYLLFISMASIVFVACSNDEYVNQPEAWEMELIQVRAVTEKYLDIDVATDEGCIDVSGYIPNMGHHYLNPALADATFELLNPEFILYVPADNGEMEMVAIEYGIVPEDVDNPGNPPEGFTGDKDEWYFNDMIGMWTLHVWIQLENPDGVFATHNSAIGD